MSREFNPVKGMVVRHFKGGMYKVLSVAKHTETEEQLVIYQSMEDETKVFSRPYDMFCSLVDTAKYPDVTQKYRFEAWAMISDEIETPQDIVDKFADLAQAANKLGTPIVFNTHQDQDLVLYFNEDYNKILVDKSFISQED